jgi:hypothetical protein
LYFQAELQPLLIIMADPSITPQAEELTDQQSNDQGWDTVVSTKMFPAFICYCTDFLMGFNR